jgi:Protein of unknown function (DUF3800)
MAALIVSNCCCSFHGSVFNAVECSSVLRANEYMIYAAYFDESNDHERAYCVGGFIGAQLDCVHLDWAWKERILDAYKLKYFKASELEHGTGEFRQHRENPNHADARFTEREKALFTEIKTKTIDIFLDAQFLISFGAVVVLPDYHRLVDEFKVRGFDLPAPYWFGAQVCFMEAGYIMDYLNDGTPKSQQSQVSPIFDAHEEYGRKAKQVFDAFREKNPKWSKWVLNPHYEDDQDYIVLQVADNLAYEIRKLMIKDAFNEVRPERKAMTRLKQRIWKIYKLNYEGLKKVMEAQTNVIPIGPDIHNPSTLLGGASQN